MTPMEHAIQGLTSRKCALLEVKDCGEKGRGIFASTEIAKGNFVCEYETTAVYPRKERAKYEQEYEGLMQFGKGVLLPC